MKKIFLISSTILLSFCGTKKNIISQEKNIEITKESLCPIDGSCNTVILKNKSLVIKTDEFGSIFTETIDNETTSVIIYQYNRTINGDLQDAGYREELIFEIKKEKLDEIAKGIKSIMEEIMHDKETQGVPVVSNSAKGQSWGTLKDF